MCLFWPGGDSFYNRGGEFCGSLLCIVMITGSIIYSLIISEPCIELQDQSNHCPDLMD